MRRPSRPEVTGWLSKMPDALSIALLVGAIGCAGAVYTRLNDLDRQLDGVRIEQRVTAERVDEIRRYVMRSAQR